MNETFQIYFATSVRNSNCDLGEREVRHLDGSNGTWEFARGEGGMCSFQFLAAMEEKNFPTKGSFYSEKAIRFSNL